MDRALQGPGGRSQGASWIDQGDRSPVPACAPEALEALTSAAERLRASGDPRAAFPDIYAIITRRVSDRVALGPGRFFLEPEWISTLAGRFCQRYLETLWRSLAGRPQDTEAWAVAYAASELDSTTPLANVLLGLSAHINFDLAIGIYRTIVELGATDHARIARYKHDHDAVNELLEASIPEAFDRLITRHRCPVSRALFHRAYAVSRWTAVHFLTSWRARVWDDALELVFAGRAEAREAVLRRLDRRSGRYARLLALSVPHVGAPPRDPRGRGGRASRRGALARHLRALG
jgi:hypothetical protein